MKWWKVLGLAGVAGVAATGAVVARRERERRLFTPDEVRDRLHARHADLAAADAVHATGANPTSSIDADSGDID